VDISCCAKSTTAEEAMNGKFELRDLDEIRDYLFEFDPATRRRGMALWKRRGVTQLTEHVRDDSQLLFIAIVRDPKLYRVELSHEVEFGWAAFCSCREETMCDHGYAALRELLSRSIIPVPGIDEPARAAALPLSDVVKGHLGRELKQSEAGILRRVEMQLHSIRLVGRVTGWDLSVMGFEVNRQSMFPSAELPWIPRSALELLHLVIWMMTEHSLPIPPFLQALPPDPELATRIPQARLGKQIEAWKNVWRNLSPSPVARGLTAPQPIQLRFRFTAQGAIAEWLPSSGGNFRVLKKGDLQEQKNRVDHGQALLDSGTALLWSVLEPRQHHGVSLTLSYGMPDDAARLRMLLSQPPAAGHLVNTTGGPLLRPSEPLRWQLTPPDSDPNACYRLQIVRHDGRPLSSVHGILRGVPTYYIGVDAVYQGPALPQGRGSVNWLAEQEIPIGAVENPEGILALRNLGVVLPEKLESQIHVIPVKVKIGCRLTRPHKGSEEEICFFDVSARSTDKLVQERWSLGGSWLSTAPFSRTAAGATVARPIIYDRSLQERAAALLAQLPLRPHFNGRPTLKVNKAFAQIFLNWLRSVPPEIPVQLEGELASLARDPLAGRLQLQAEEVGIDWFDLKVVVDVADTELTPEELKLLLAKPGQPVRLRDKGWRRLAFDLTEQQDQQLARLGLSPRQLTDEPQRLHALQLADHAARDLLPDGQSERIQRRASEIRARITPPPPGDVRATLRPYQTEGFHFLAYLATNHFGGILADDMGLGKTLQTLVWISWLHQTNGTTKGDTVSPANPLPSLVVCPKSVTDNWRAEAGRFTPGLKVKVWSGLALADLAGHINDAQIHVINYAQLRLADEQLNPVRWLAVILDEGQFIKNPNSQTAQAARRLQAQHRLILSGTPIENRLLDLWSLLNFAMPGVLGNRATFQRIYDATHDPLARQRLAARVRPFLLRRTKAQVAKDLPDRIEEDLYCEMDGLQRTLYQAELKHARQMLLQVRTSSDLAAHQFNFLTSLLRLRQICCHPALVNSEHRGESTKVNALMEQLEPLMAEGHKVLVFSQFVGLLELLEPGLKARNWPFFVLTGATENRADRVEAFQSAEGGAIFLLSLKAGGFGLNLTAASYVMLFDPWWNPAVENQAIDRTHRIGQNRTVIAYRLLVKDSIEEKVRLLQKQKKSLAEDILGEERFAQALSLDDFQFLFSD
jgi:hypothetical protein